VFVCYGRPGMSDELPPDLRAQLDAFLVKKPDLRGLVDKLAKKHAAAESSNERQLIEKLLRDIMSPSRAAWWIGGAILSFALFVLVWGFWSDRQRAESLAHSVPATALVKRMDDGDCMVGTKTSRCLRLELEVHRDGAEPYTGSLTHDIGLQWMSRVQPGQWLTIGVNPDDPNELLFNEEAMAVAPPAPPTK
jgi:hypothetical protein